MTPEMFERLINAIDSTDWISNVIGIFSIVIPICYAISISKKDTKELDERQKKLEEIQGGISNNIKLLSEYQVKIGLYEKRQNSYYFFKDLGDNWTFYYENVKSNPYLIPLNYFCKDYFILNQIEIIVHKLEAPQIDKLVEYLTEKYNIHDREFENLKLYYSLSEDDLVLIKEIKIHFEVIYGELLTFLNEIKNNRVPKVDFKSNGELYNIFKLKNEKDESTQYASLLYFLETELLINYKK